LARTPESHGRIIDAGRIAFELQTVATSTYPSARTPSLEKDNSEQISDDQGPDSSIMMTRPGKRLDRTGQPRPSELQSILEIAGALHDIEALQTPFSQHQIVSMNPSFLESPDIFAHMDTDPQLSELTSAPDISNMVGSLEPLLEQQIGPSVDSTQCLFGYSNGNSFPGLLSQHLDHEPWTSEEHNFSALEPIYDIPREGNDFDIGEAVFSTDTGNPLVNFLDLETAHDDPSSMQLFAKSRRQFLLKAPEMKHCISATGTQESEAGVNLRQIQDAVNNRCCE
jgi:hypothetical protein